MLSGSSMVLLMEGLRSNDTILCLFENTRGTGTKKRSRIRKNQAPEKKSGIELLSHSQICSTIVAGPLIDRVRDGNVSYKPAMDTGKKRIKDARFMQE